MPSARAPARGNGEDAPCRVDQLANSQQTKEITGTAVRNPGTPEARGGRRTPELVHVVAEPLLRYRVAGVARADRPLPQQLPRREPAPPIAHHPAPWAQSGGGGSGSGGGGGSLHCLNLAVPRDLGTDGGGAHDRVDRVGPRAHRARDAREEHLQLLLVVLYVTHGVDVQLWRAPPGKPQRSVARYRLGAAATQKWFCIQQSRTSVTLKPSPSTMRIKPIALSCEMALRL
jgi:hypothetical protein